MFYAILLSATAILVVLYLYARKSTTVRAYEPIDTTSAQASFDTEYFLSRREELLSVLQELRPLAASSMLFQTAFTLTEEACSVEDLDKATEFAEQVARECAPAFWARRAQEERSAAVRAVAEEWRNRLNVKHASAQPPRTPDPLRQLFFGE